MGLAPKSRKEWPRNFWKIEPRLPASTTPLFLPLAPLDETLTHMDGLGGSTWGGKKTSTRSMTNLFYPPPFTFPHLHFPLVRLFPWSSIFCLIHSPEVHTSATCLPGFQSMTSFPASQAGILQSVQCIQYLHIPNLPLPSSTLGVNSVKAFRFHLSVLPKIEFYPSLLVGYSEPAIAVTCNFLLS